jgi:hypothetical protein
MPSIHAPHARVNTTEERVSITVDDRDPSAVTYVVSIDRIVMRRSGGRRAHATLMHARCCQYAVQLAAERGLAAVDMTQGHAVTLWPLEAPEHDDTLPPEAEDASYARWADGYLHDLDVEQVALTAMHEYYERPLTPEEDFEAFLASECGSVPTPRYKTTGCDPIRIGYVADDAC